MVSGYRITEGRLILDPVFDDGRAVAVLAAVALSSANRAYHYAVKFTQAADRVVYWGSHRSPRGQSVGCWVWVAFCICPLLYHTLILGTVNRL